MSVLMTALLALTGTDGGLVREVNGDLIKVSRAPGNWRVGLPVVVLWSASELKQPAILAHGTIEQLSGEVAFVRIETKNRSVKTGQLVFARHRVERLLFGTGTSDAEAAEDPPAPRYRHSQHTQAIHWGESLWLELVGPEGADKVAIMYRIGKEGPFSKQHMHRGELNQWSGRLKTGKPVPGADTVQYFFIDHRQGKSRAALGDFANPFGVKVISKPHHHGGHRATHHPSNRWRHKEPMLIRAQFDKTLSVPVLHYRLAGEARYEAQPMEEVDGGLWVATVPGDKMLIPGVRYYLSAMDQPGHRHPVFRNAMNPQRVRVVRGRMLDGLKMRNRLTVGAEVSGKSLRRNLRYERAFFPFLLSRIAYKSWNEPNGVGAVNGGGAGLELRVQNFFAATMDLDAMSSTVGEVLGYRFGLRIGDEMGASIGGSYAYNFSLDDGSSRGERLQFKLAVPMAKHYQVAGRVDYDGSFAPDNPALRLTAEVTGRLYDRFQIGLSGGSSNRGDTMGLSIGGSLALGF